MLVIQLDRLRSWSAFWEAYGANIFEALVKILIIIVGYLVLRWLLFKVITHVLDGTVSRLGTGVFQARKARVQALQSVAKSVTAFVLGFVAIIMILQVSGVQVIAPLAAAGVVGLAVGFGAQKLVRDVISGFFILAEDLYGVGDFITVGTVSGVVEELGMRVTKIRDKAGKLFIISNGDITQIFNASRGEYQVTIDLNVPADTDVEKACDVLNVVGEQVTQVMTTKITEPFRCEGIIKITGAAATIRIRGGVLPYYQDEVEMELNKLIRHAFREHDLKLA